jgi:hypothetical protein
VGDKENDVKEGHYWISANQYLSVSHRRLNQYQIVGLSNSSYFAGHDAPHFGQALGLNAVGNLLRLVGIAFIDRWYDLVISRRFKLIPDCLGYVCYESVVTRT